MNTEYYAQLEAAGHVLRRDEFDESRIDSFVMDIGYHNGPGCINCHDSWCEHCEDKIEPCIGKEQFEANARESRYQTYLKLREEFPDV